MTILNRAMEHSQETILSSFKRKKSFPYRFIWIVHSDKWNSSWIPLLHCFLYYWMKEGHLGLCLPWDVILACWLLATHYSHSIKSAHLLCEMWGRGRRGWHRMSSPPWPFYKGKSCSTASPVTDPLPNGLCLQALPEHWRVVHSYSQLEASYSPVLRTGQVLASTLDVGPKGTAVLPCVKALAERLQVGVATSLCPLCKKSEYKLSWIDCDPWIKDSISLLNAELLQWKCELY